MTTYTFKIVVEPDEDRWRAYQPELEAQGAATWGYTRDEALQNIREVLEMIVAELVEDGKPVPRFRRNRSSPSRYESDRMAPAAEPYGSRDHYRSYPRRLCAPQSARFSPTLSPRQWAPGYRHISPPRRHFSNRDASLDD
jgi:predicted RNase H-like HicB family nuclease